MIDRLIHELEIQGAFIPGYLKEEARKREDNIYSMNVAEKVRDIFLRLNLDWFETAFEMYKNLGYVVGGI